MPKQKSQYTFSLSGINIEEIDKQFGLTSNKTDFKVDTNISHNIPQNSTNIDELDNRCTPEIISFLDESKKKRSCNICMIDMNTNKPLNQRKKYKCYWCRHYIPENVKPLGIPIRYVPNRVIRKYYSELSKEEYVISECVTEKRAHEISLRKTPQYSIEYNGYYETDGIVCGFNCMFAFIDDNCKNPLYQRSETLGKQMCQEFNDGKIDEIIKARHWRELEEHGGPLSIEKFRESFNKIESINHGIITQKPLGMLFEENYRLM